MSSVTQKNPIRLFVAHVWAKDDDYLRIFEYVESVPNFFYSNTSTPEVRPPGDREVLRESLRNQITAAWFTLPVRIEPVSTSIRPTMSGSADLMNRVMPARTRLSLRR